MSRPVHTSSPLLPSERYDRLAAVQAPQNPETIPGDWPEDPLISSTIEYGARKVSDRSRIASRPVRSSQAKIKRNSACDKNPNSLGCCIEVLKKAGDLPLGKLTKDGFARTIPTVPLKLKEGETAVIATKESRMGHVLKVVMKNGELISIKEGGMGKKSVGRKVNKSVVKGRVHIKIKG